MISLPRAARAKLLFIYFRSEDKTARGVAVQVIEEGKDYDFGKGWAVRRDRGHHDPSNYHCHVQLRGQDVSVINSDGTQSHSTNRDQLPNWVVDRMVAQKLIKEGFEPLDVYEVDPELGDKVRRIEKYGVAFELDLITEVRRVLAAARFWRLD